MTQCPDFRRFWVYSRLGHVGQKWYWNTYLHHVAFIYIYISNKNARYVIIMNDCIRGPLLGPAKLISWMRVL